jgi:23S rRNA (adenine2503-C2)-methyltransferase
MEDLKLSLPLIFDFNFGQLEAIFSDLNEPKFRVKQLWQGIYIQLWNKPDQFTNFPKTLRDKLFNTFSFDSMIPEKILQSSDHETVKTLLKLYDGRAVEAVLMKYDQRRTLCISTQAGCAMGCIFCATGQMGFQRNLTAGEIIEQVLHYARLLQQDGERVTNIVLMGMGEPFHNYESTMQAIDTLNDADGFNLGARRFTISTVGLVPMIKKFADENRQVNLAISLHEATDEERSKLLPVNKKYPIRTLLDVCRYYIEKTNRRITFEWALIAGYNDDVDTAKKLAELLKGLLCHVNVIPLNPTANPNLKAPTKEQTIIFQQTLENNGIPCTIRLRRGIDIQAGCGQLAIKHNPPTNMI